MFQSGTFDTAVAEDYYNNAYPFAIMEVLSLATMSFACPDVTAPVMFLTGKLPFLPFCRLNDAISSLRRSYTHRCCSVLI
jgi:hypothetical protein